MVNGRIFPFVCRVPEHNRQKTYGTATFIPDITSNG